MKKYSLSADHHFHIGLPHTNSGKPCQDYAVSGELSDVTYAVVSDGCSNAGATDVGSRLVALATVSALRKSTHASEVFDHCRATLENMQGALDLDRSDLCATRLYAVLGQNGGYVSVVGDGAVAFKYASGEVRLFVYSWERTEEEGSFPYYPAYSMHGGSGEASFVKIHGNDPSAPWFREEVLCRDPSGVWRSENTRVLSLVQGMKGIVLPVSEFEMEDLSFVALFSDGVSAVSKQSVTETADLFLGFKQLKGEFVKRTSIWAAKDLRKKGLEFTDDLAIAVIAVQRALATAPNFGRTTEETS